jgi:Ca2+-binding EF-hand superfamily protein
MNIPALQLECSFSRKELYSIFTKFKALSKISALVQQRQNPGKSDLQSENEIGVAKEVFMSGLKHLSLDNTDFLEKIFTSVDKSNKGYLVWEEFFAALKLISSTDLNDKIDLFFQIVDADGNGSFSFPEIRQICQLSMSKINKSEGEVLPQDRMSQDTADFYARLIFQLLGKELDEEIPSADFKLAIFHGSQEQKELLSMFCMADVQLQEMYVNE